MKQYVDGDVESFTKGSKHQLTLSYPIEKVWDQYLEDEYYETELLKYYALKADVIK